MKKIIWKELKEDDPIFKQGFVISSHNKNKLIWLKYQKLCLGKRK